MKEKESRGSTVRPTTFAAMMSEAAGNRLGRTSTSVSQLVDDL